jgi:hypothetical protein
VKISLAIAIAFGVALVPLAGHAAAVKVDEGFSTRIVEDGEEITAMNRVTRAKTGDTVTYWIAWQDSPGTKQKLRCVVKSGGREGTVETDETTTIDGHAGDSITTCDAEMESKDVGTFYFAQYIDGELAGERTIFVEKQSFFGKMSAYRKAKWIWGGAFLLVFGGAWLWRKMRGDHEGAAELFGSMGEAKMSGDAVVIGARLQAEESLKAKAAAAQAAAKPPEPDPLETFRKRLAADPAARPERAEDVLPIAKAARAAGDPNTAIAAVRGFDKAHPGHNLIPDVFVFSAKLLAEDLENPQMARKILEHVTQKYPGHYLAQEARNYLKSMPG